MIAPVRLDAAYDTSVRDLKDNWRQVAGLVIVAVALTTAAVAAVTRAVGFRYAWVEGGRVSANDDEAVARMARARATAAEPGASLRVTQH